MLSASAQPFVPGRAWGQGGQQQAVGEAASDLPQPLLEQICSHVSCLVTLTRLSASSRQLAAAAARPLSELWQRWHSFALQAYIDADTPVGWQAVDRAVIAFALSDAQTKALPASLNNRARFWAHTRAAQLRLLSQSHGNGSQRRLHLTKPAGWVMSWTPAHVALPPRHTHHSSRLDHGYRPWRRDYHHGHHFYDDDDDEYGMEWPSSNEDSDDWM